MKTVRSRPLYLSLGIATLCIALASMERLSGVAEAQPATPAEAVKQPPSTKERLAEVRKLARTDAPQAAKELRSMDRASFEASELDTWFDIARSVALRTGDKDWLMSLQSHRSEFSDIYVYRILLAGGMLEEGRIVDAKAELAKIDNFENVNVRDRRRAYALQARMAWLEGDAAAERAAVERVVHELQYWGSKSCQGCHDDSKYPDTAPLLDVRNTWYAQRLVALMKQSGDAVNVRDDAEALLASDPSNVEALLKLAYSRMALGDNAKAEEAFAKIPWMRSLGREGGSPRMMTPYP
jgi:hypothetical protein